VFGFQIVVGQTYCFVFNSSTYITGCLSGIVTGLPYSGDVKVGNRVLD
jgi:hypothetical protein